MPSPTSTTTPPFRVAPILFQCYCTTSCHLKAARWYHESGGQERGGICWGQGWAPVTHHPGHGDHENRGGARPGWHPVLQPFRNVDIGYKPWLPSICCQNLRGNTQFSWIKLGKFRQLAVFLHCFILLLLGFHAIPWYALLMVEENHLITNLLLGAVIHTPWTSVGGYGGILRHTYFNSQYGLNLEGAVPRVSKDWGI